MKITSASKTGTWMLALLLLTAAGLGTAQAAHPVLVELFTSKSCSSCPPADALLRRPVASQPIAGAQVIALEEHVDYWNDMGWRDPYSAARFTGRPYQYAAEIHGSSVYASQMVVNSSVGFVGSEVGRAHAAINAAGKAQPATISVTRTYVKANNVGLRVAMKQLPADAADKAADVWLTLTEDNRADHVTAGENDGRRTTPGARCRGTSSRTHRADQTGRRRRLLRESARGVGARLAQEPPARGGFRQGATSRHILGVASLALSQAETTESNEAGGLK